MRIVFMGSPDFAVPALQALAQSYQIVGIVTQPDRPAGRGRALRPPPAKLAAEELAIPVFQPKSLRSPDARTQLAAWSPDLIVVAAYGLILPSKVLHLPKHGSINLHASLLPRWRGAAPIQAAILHGDRLTGVSVMLMDEGLDTGPVLRHKETAITSRDTGGTLSARLARLAPELLVETLPGYLAGELHPKVQDERLATYAPMLDKGDGLIRWGLTAVQLERQIRAYEPWPTSYFFWSDRRITVRQAHVDLTHKSPAGTVLAVNNMPAIGTAEGVLVLDQVQPAGKKAMSAQDFLRGARGFLGSTLPNSEPFPSA